MNWTIKIALIVAISIIVLLAVRAYSTRYRIFYRIDRGNNDNARITTSNPVTVKVGETVNIIVDPIPPFSTDCFKVVVPKIDGNSTVTKVVSEYQFEIDKKFDLIASNGAVYTGKFKKVWKW